MSPRSPDVEQALSILKDGSKSFYAASRLLPARLRADAAAIYAFCRVADDAIDLSDDPTAALELLRHRLDLIYRGEPQDDPVDRLFGETAQRCGIPRAVPEALLEGFAWDAEGRRYQSFSQVVAYSVRVAATVGVMMTHAMLQRADGIVLARACDLGVAMQLTNIARDVGEDARNGRVYLPGDWLAEQGLDPAGLVAASQFSAPLGRVVARLLDEAQALYQRGETGIGSLPADCRRAILAARLIYADIGRVIRKRGYDSLNRRAVVSKLRKLILLYRAGREVRRLPELDRAPALIEAEALVAGPGEHAEAAAPVEQGRCPTDGAHDR